jgi:hypothetical protein
MQAALAPDLTSELGGGAGGMAEDAEEIPGRPVFSVGARLRVLAAMAPGISPRIATGCGEAIVTAFDPRTREYKVKALALYSPPRWARLPPRRPPPRKLPPPWKLPPPRKLPPPWNLPPPRTGPPRRPPPMRLARKRLYRPSCRKSLAAARVAWPRTPRRSPGGQRN